MKDQQIVHRLVSSHAPARRLAALGGGRRPGPWAASRLFAAILLGLAMLAAVPAQQRAPAFGRVVDGAGEPVLQVFVDGTPRGSTGLSWGTGDLDVRIE